jgi:drug/metabolite transporter (DMT)-like permease
LALTTLALVLASATIHALWNLIVVRSEDRAATTAIVIAVGALVALPFALLRWHVGPQAWPLILVSSAIEIAYFALLTLAYQRAEMSLVYPIARGMAPVIVLVVSVLLLGAPTSVAQVAGVLLVSVGVLLVRGLRGSSAQWQHVELALAVAASIAAYTLVDKEGVRFADPVAYVTLVLGLPGLVAIGWVLGRGGVPRLRRALTPAAAMGGFFSISAYVLVLFALTMAPAAPVAAVREVGVVIAAILGAVVLKEQSGPARIAGAIVVVGGVALIVLG